MLDAAKQEVGVFAMLGSWQWLGEHVGWVVSTSKPDNGHFCVDVTLPACDPRSLEYPSNSAKALTEYCTNLDATFVRGSLNLQRDS